MMYGVNISKLGLLLTCLFSLFFFALLAEILFLLLSHRRQTTTDDDEQDQPSSSVKAIDFLHSFHLRFKRQPTTRVEPSGAQPTHDVAISEPSSSSSVEDPMKIHNYSRLLFTIQEEEREGVDCYSSGRSPSLEDHRRKGKMNTVEKASSVEIIRAEVDETPFETPCASPLDYYTPSASPHQFLPT